MNCSVRVEDLGEKSIIVVHVQQGTKRPYYLASKGPRPEGVFIRSGAATLPSSESSILRMIQQTEQDSFETRPSLQQDLTFEFATNEFRRKELNLGADELRTLGARTPRSYTNLGLLLSDQCPPTIKAALFSDDSRTTFTAREEYSGSILKQLADAYDFSSGTTITKQPLTAWSASITTTSHLSRSARRWSTRLHTASTRSRAPRSSRSCQTELRSCPSGAFHWELTTRT